ncbi:class I SAM-dependent methyltransferase [Pontibacter diazotrophicus]|uniref:Class I SAM-dependent methyltransferase n=1 Tax=Pontibacter diazotrophicus TaxID=1400979 RepID=A0A3D8LG40_9BACT|nr:class I SAM-dependent methyltransferase [Pontibacter diazotrophicus]RDV16380.1 class I SAM-dependent methyltransferase [Pontibacter diazotrophicus]
MNVPAIVTLPAIFGNIDIYLFDQLLKGRIREGMTVFDAGCGAGRNIEYLLKAGVTVYGADISAEAINQVRQLALQENQEGTNQNFIVADLADLPYPDESFDVVLCSAVLHFAKDEQHFRSIVQELWRVLKPGGMLFSRLSTTIGMAGKLQQVNERQYQMPHGQVWFLADEALLREMASFLPADFLEPLKTVLVEQERSMTTWVLQKQ